MTTQRRLENDLTDLSDQTLQQIDPETRLKLAMEARADGDHDLYQRLHDTAPRKEYRIPDAQFVTGIEDAHSLAMLAWHELERGTWAFLYERVNGMYRMLQYRRYGDDCDRVDEPMDDDPLFELDAMKAAGRFHRDFLAWQWFADKVLDVSLETFLKYPLPDASVDSIFDVAALADGSAMDHLDDADDIDFGWASGITIEHSGAECTPEEAAKIKFDELCDVWVENDPLFPR